MSGKTQTNAFTTGTAFPPELPDFGQQKKFNTNSGTISCDNLFISLRFNRLILHPIILTFTSFFPRHLRIILLLLKKNEYHFSSKLIE